MHVPTASSSSMEEASHGPTASSSSMEEASTQASLGGGVSDSSTSASAGKRRPRTQGQGGGPEGYLRSLWNSFFGDATEKVMDKRIVVTILLLGVSSLVTGFGCSQTTVVVVNALSSTATCFHAAFLWAKFALSSPKLTLIIFMMLVALSPGANATPISGTDAGCGYDAASLFLWNILRLFSSFFLFAMVIRVLWSTTLIMLALMFRLRLNAA